METPSFFRQALKSGFSLPCYQNQKEYYPGTDCLLLDGRRLLQDVVEQCKSLFLTEKKTKPNLAVILVGDNSASQVYVNNKRKTFEKAGFSSNLFLVSTTEATLDKIVNYIHQLNSDNSCDGILIQLPLPKHLDTKLIFRLIDRRKDVDGFSPSNIGLLALNDPTGMIACTPFGIMMLLSAYNIQLSGKNCVVVGRSAIVGKPIGLLLLNANATVTFTHSQTDNLFSYTQAADILIVAAGKKHLIQKDHIKCGVIIIDVGIHRNADGALSGDVHPNVTEKAAALTPVPGGVGPTTIAGLLVNTTISHITNQNS